MWSNCTMSSICVYKGVIFTYFPVQDVSSFSPLRRVLCFSLSLTNFGAFFYITFLKKSHNTVNNCCCLVTKSCLTLATPWTVCNPPGSFVHGISQARILEWIVIPSPGDLPNPGVKLKSPALQADSLLSEPPGSPQWSKPITKGQIACDSTHMRPLE